MASRRRQRGPETQLAFEAISIEGSLLSADWLARVAQQSAGSQSDPEYRVPKGLVLRDEIGRYWRIAQAHWSDFSKGRASKGDARALAESFVHSLLRDCFGFASLEKVSPITIKDRTYPVGATALGGRVPVVVAPAGAGLDALSSELGDGSRKRSAFGLAQEFLNASDDAMWGIVSDGLSFRILRDNASLTRPAWVEADLARIFTEERFADFAALWLLAHETRFGAKDRPPSDCALETWRNAGQEEGTRAREQLRKGVEDALVALGSGFLGHPENGALRSELEKGTLTKEAFFQQLLRLVYRLIFLLTAEERGVLHDPSATEEAKLLYAEGYGMRRLRDRSVRRNAYDRYGDLWEALRIVLRGLARGEPRLGLPALGGLFDTDQCPMLDGAKLENRALLYAVFRLSWLRDDGSLSRVNWRDMGPEELGSVYESLLELVPQITEGGRRFGFATGAETRGNARKTTGSYYTPDSLVQVLLDSALEPVIEEAIAKHPEAPVDALLELSIVDPACGSGHFLLSAARRLAAHVARIEANGTPSGEQYRHALRRVVGRCIFGVDLNPMAVELCKVSLWMEAVEPGRPLSFLDSHIQYGNALLGATPELLEKGIPDAAWEPIEGDDKKIASALKKQNKKERVERSLDLGPPPASTYARIGAGARAVDAAADESLDAVEKKEKEWRDLVASAAYQHQRFVADLWCAAFVWRKEPGRLRDLAPTEATFRAVQKEPGRASRDLRDEVERLREQYKFFHWHLAFPQVFAKGGFDVVIGNPPWIAHAGRAAQPLPPGVKRFYEINYAAFANYPTTHGLFASVIPRVLRPHGYLGLVIPSSVSELGSYTPVRTAHDCLCEFMGELTDFGDGCFEGVTQPCMALVSRRTPEGRRDEEPGAPWPMARPDLTAADRRLLERLRSLPTVPAELFGERGVQSDRSLAAHFVKSPEPTGRFTTPVREGTDVREFALLAPRLHVDRGALGNRIRSVEEFAAVRFVVRQTARYPIAALSDGLAFRNSLLAGFELDDWPAEAMVALLNSALIRWLHYQRFRDARQPVMPQVKIAHLRAIPVPQQGLETRALCDIAKQMTETRGQKGRARLDELVATMYGLSDEERAAVSSWHQQMGPTSSRLPGSDISEQGTPLRT